MIKWLCSLSESRIKFVVVAVSLALFAVVATLSYIPPIDLGIQNLGLLPAFNAVINATCSVLLVLGVVFIKNGMVKWHKRAMGSTFVLSTLFLISYVLYHSQAPSTSFGGEGVLRYIYFFILITHIILAAGILPLVIYTLLRALRNELDQHRKIARITFPLWLYVTVTGVVVYVMISPYYAH